MTIKKFIESNINIKGKNKNSVFIELYELLANFCNEFGYGDPYNYSRSKEIYLACILNHKISSNYSGEDGFNEIGDKVEYKSTINKNIKATYNGISVQKTWELQKDYLKKEKLACYKEHYFSRFENNRVVEIWKTSGMKVYNILLPKIKKQWEMNKYKNKKDPRLGVQLNQREIKKISIRVL